MEHETYTLKGILAALRMIDETRDKMIASEGDFNSELYNLLNDIEDYITGNLEDEVE